MKQMRVIFWSASVLWVGMILGFGAFGSSARADIRDAEFVRNNLLHVVYHEFGHALIDQFDLPVLGQEEDAADAFATLQIIERRQGQASDILRDVIEGWLVLHTWNEGEQAENFYGEHDLDAQRGFRVACHLYGSSPVRYRKVAQWVDLPSWRKDSCADDANLAARSWNDLLDGIRLPDTKKPMKIKLVYEDHGKFEDELEFLHDTRMLEEAAEMFSNSFDWPKPLKLTVMQCGHSNAYWDPSEVEIEVCYEFITELSQLARARRTVGWKPTKKRGR